MRYLTAVMVILLVAAVWSMASESGEVIFKSQGCASCHHSQSTSKVNPSLSAIAAAYSGKKDQLIQYLKGQAESIVKPEKASMMKRYIQKTQALSDEDRMALADFVLSHK